MSPLLSLRVIRAFGLSFIAAGLLATSGGTVLARDRQGEGCDLGVLELEAPRVRAIMEEAAKAERGHGQPADAERAAILYCEAASYGSLEAQYRLGRMMMDGRGVPRDLSIAATLFGIASDAGHMAARSMLLVTGEREPKLPGCLLDFQAGRGPLPTKADPEQTLRLSTRLVTRIR